MIIIIGNILFKMTVDIKRIYKFYLVFILLLPVLCLMHMGIFKITHSDLLTFLLMHIPCLFMLERTRFDFLWLILTLGHGLAHIYHPAFTGIIRNNSYTPLYDYIVHSAQCLTALYSPLGNGIEPIAIFIAITMQAGAVIAHLHENFMAIKPWLAISSGGVFGTFFHMSLLNKKQDLTTVIIGAILWTLPYVGYLDFDQIPQNDYLLNTIGLFKYWYLNYFYTIFFLNKYFNLVL